MSAQVDLVKAFIQMEGKINIDMTCEKLDGSIEFSDKFVLDKENVDLVNECKTIKEVYTAYREMEFFPEPEAAT
jgi:hypothetical protein